MKRLILILPLLLISISVCAQEFDILFQQCYGGSGTDEIWDVYKKAEGGYYVFASSTSSDGDLPFNYGRMDFWLFETDASGQILWQKIYGSLGYERLDWSGVQDIGDGRYVITATLQTNGNSGDINCMTTPAGGSDIWLIQLRDTTYTSINEQADYSKSFSLYPNPATLSTWIELPEHDIHAFMQLQLISPTGRTLYEALAKGRFHQIVLESYPAGLYLVRLWDGERWRVQKLMKH